MKNALVVDDQPATRFAVKTLLAEMGYKVNECDNGIHALNAIRTKEYHIVVMEIQIPGIDGIFILNSIKRIAHRPKTLIFTALPASVYVGRCIKNGARGFLSKHDDVTHLSTAIRSLEAGYAFFPKEIARTPEETRQLSNRELSVLRYIIAGKSNVEIAKDMCLSKKTISTYKTRVMRKLGVSSFVELIFAAKNSQLT